MASRKPLRTFDDLRCLKVRAVRHNEVSGYFTSVDLGQALQMEIINLNFWNSLSQDMQTLLTSVMREAEARYVEEGARRAMDGLTLAVCAVAVLFLLLALRVLIAFALLATGIVGIWVVGATRFGGFNPGLGWRSVLSLLGRDPYSFVANFTLMAIPAFLLMGNLAFFSGATADAYRTARNPALAPRMVQRAPWKTRILAAAGTWQLMLVFGVVMGVIYTGIATPTEAAVIGALAVLVLLGICALYLILGCFLDPVGILLLTLPVVLPVVDAVQYNLVWFGVLVVKLLEVGMVTPPVGLNVFVLKAAVGESVTLEQAFKGVVGFICTDVLIIALMIALPEIVLWLPGLMRG